jgi:fatty-acyl-CoA synthase
MDYEAVVTSPVTGPVRGPWGRSPDDLLLLYTGGTTGMPKGVMWRQDDLFNVLGAGGNATLGIPPAESLAELASRVTPANPGLVLLSACPLMHGTGQFSSLIAMNLGGTIVSLPSRHFDVAELFEEVQRNKVNSIIIVGQAFAGPFDRIFSCCSSGRVTSMAYLFKNREKSVPLHSCPFTPLPTSSPFVPFRFAWSSWSNCLNT